MRHYWFQIAFAAYGAFSVFCSFMPAPGSEGAPKSVWYPPVFHTLQYLSMNPGRSQGLLKYGKQNGQNEPPTK